MPFLTPFFGEGSPTKIDQKEKVGTLSLTSLLKDLAEVWAVFLFAEVSKAPEDSEGTGHQEIRHQKIKKMQVWAAHRCPFLLN